jgi:hypothetical protein
MRRAIAIVTLAALALTPVPAHAATTVKGSYGQSISVAKIKVAAGTSLVVSGRGFDETVGLYLAYCVIPGKGKAPTPCGGGVNKAGMGEASYWISSNPPPYAVGLTDEFLPGGRFKHSVKISTNIGKFDCRKVRCAITVRSDHLRTGDRSNDLFIPITLTR